MHLGMWGYDPWRSCFYDNAVYEFEFQFDSGTGEDVDDDCVGDLLTAYAKKSTKPVLIVWVRYSGFIC